MQPLLGGALVSQFRSCVWQHFPRAGMLCPDNVVKFGLLGFQFLEPCQALPSQVHAIFPTGWKFHADLVNGYACLLDDKLRDRVLMRPSAINAYDLRLADVHFVHFYELWVEGMAAPEGRAMICYELVDGTGKTLTRGCRMIPDSYLSVRYHIEVAQLRERVYSSLDRVYPQHGDPLAYWDD